MDLTKLWQLVLIQDFVKSQEKPQEKEIFQSHRDITYFVLGCQKPAGMPSRGPRSNVVSSP